MKKYEWYYNRLKAMSTSEITYRTKKAIKNKIFKNIKITNDIKFCINNKIKDYIDSLDLEFMTVDLKFCENCIKHRFKIFDTEYYYGTNIDWRLDVKNNIKSKLMLWNKINYRDSEKYGDIKYIFEINKLQQLPILAFSYKKTKDKRILSEITYEILSWIDQNPYKMSINWTSSIECSYRNLSILFTYYLLYEDIKDEEAKKAIEKIIYLNGEYIIENLSLYSSANNHYLSELLGLFLTGIMYNSEDKKMKAWIKYSYNELLKEMYKQNNKDGVNKEQATWYHAAVTDIYILFIKICEVQGLRVEKKYYSLLEKMCEYIMYSYGSCKVQPNVGDRDEEIILKLDIDKKYDYFKSILTSGAIMFKRVDFKFFSGGIDNRNIFLFGRKGIETFNSLKNKNIKLKDKIFVYGGYGYFYDDSSEVKFDFGKLGYLSLAGHGHADCLSFQLFKNGMGFLVDSGTYCYHTKPQWRYYFKSTAAHNTVEVNGESQSQYGGSFLWLHKADGKLLNYSINDKCSIITASHNGYKKNGVSHIRTLYFVKNKFLLIQDKINNNQKNNFTWNYHLSNGCNLYKKEKHYVVTNEKESISIQFYPYKTVETCLGWESYRLNEKHKVIKIKIEIESNENLVQYTLINLDGKNRIIKNTTEEDWIFEDNNKVINFQEVLG